MSLPRFEAQCLGYGRGVFTIGVVLAIIAITLSEPLIKLFSERGEFSADDAARVATLVIYAGILIPFYLTSMVAVSALLAQARLNALTVAAALNGN